MIKTADIINKVFTKSFMGYDVREVDAYLDEIIDELERLQKERLEMAQALEQLLLELDGKRPGRLAAPQPAIDGAEGAKRLERGAAVRRIAVRTAASPDGAIPEAAAREIVSSVALELETGAAAPRRKAAAADIAKADAADAPVRQTRADLS